MAQRNEGMVPRHAKTPRPNTGETINEIAIPLEHIINPSFVTGSIPVNLKIANKNSYF